MSTSTRKKTVNLTKESRGDTAAPCPTSTTWAENIFIWRCHMLQVCYCKKGINGVNGYVFLVLRSKCTEKRGARKLFET